MGRKENNQKGTSFLLRFIRIVLSVVLLSALILGITLFIKQVSTLDSVKLSGIFNNLLSAKETKAGAGRIGTFINNLLERLKKNNIDLSYVSGSLLKSSDGGASSGSNDNKKLLLKLCILADIHQDKANLSKTLEKVKSSGCKSTLVIGDLTNYGDVSSLSEIKNVLDLSGIEYYAIPGDHDLAQSVGIANFKKVFGINYHLLDFLDVKFLMIDNSANFTPIDLTQTAWIQNNIKNVNFILLSQPLYVEGLTLPFNSMFMGSLRTPPVSADLKEKQQIVNDQGKSLLALIRSTENVKAIFAGEHHSSSKLVDPVRAGLTHYVIGAVTSTVDELPQSAIQASRFSVLTVYEDKTYSVEDILID